jgi:hypothetical protein
MNHDNPQHCCKNASSVVMELKWTDTGAVPLTLQQEAARFGSMGRSGMHGPA